MLSTSTWVFQETVRFIKCGVEVSKSGGGNRYRMCLVRGSNQGEQTWRLQFTRSKLSGLWDMNNQRLLSKGTSVQSVVA